MRKIFFSSFICMFIILFGYPIHAQDMSSIHISEFLPSPKITDWDGDGTASSNDEWIEISNTSDQEIALDGWTLDDIEQGGSNPYVFPATILAPNSTLLLFQKETGIILNNSDEYVRLLDASNTIISQCSWELSKADTSYTCITGIAIELAIPSPWLINPIPTVTATSTETCTATQTVLVTSTSTGTPIPQSPTPTPSLVAFTSSKTLRISEIFPAPSDKKDWDGDGVASAEDEWIELRNYGEDTIHLKSWMLDDAEGGSKPYVFPEESSISANGCLVFSRKQTGIVLNNTTDTVRLYSGTVLVDSYTYEGIKSDQSVQWNANAWSVSSNPNPLTCSLQEANSSEFPPSFASTGIDLFDFIWELLVAFGAIFWYSKC